jgi:muramoyltetrapeptide carboxypeptidase
MRPPARPIIPPFLMPGDPITVVAPSGVVDRTRLERGLSYLASRGHPARVAPHALSRHGHLAGDDGTRAGDLNDLIAASPATAWLFARGGYGLTRILDRLDLDALRRRPRLLMGYSDFTALAMALQRRGPYLVHYGPLVSELGESGMFDEKSLWGHLRGDPASFPLRFRPSDVLRPGRGSGLVLGGCLSLLVTLLGTPHDPDYRGAILFWEEIGEEPYRIDRMLTQLRNAGKFDHLRGMIVGSLTGCEAPRGKPSLRLRDVILELVQDARFPVVWNARAGHLPRKRTLLLGARGSLDTRRGSLTYSLR